MANLFEYILTQLYPGRTRSVQKRESTAGRGSTPKRENPVGRENIQKRENTVRHESTGAQGEVQKMPDIMAEQGALKMQQDVQEMQEQEESAHEGERTENNV